MSATVRSARRKLAPALTEATEYPERNPLRVVAIGMACLFGVFALLLAFG